MNKTVNYFDFGEAVRKLKEGKKVARRGWNGKGIYIELQRPDENSKMTLPIFTSSQRSLKQITLTHPKVLFLGWLLRLIFFRMIGMKSNKTE